MTWPVRLLLFLLNAIGLCRPPVQHVVEGNRSPDWPRVRKEIPKVSREKLAWFVANHQPPQSWYDEEWER